MAGIMIDCTHIPVLLKETLEYLDPAPDKTIVDCTLGLGGHAKAILGKLGKSGHLIGIDRDEQALEIAKENLKAFKSSFIPVKGDFRDIKDILSSLKVGHVDGILMDLGLSSLQIDLSERGFSLRNDGPLDMRMDRSRELTASDMVNGYDAEDLGRVIREYGEERLYKKIANGIIRYRERGPIDTTLKLVDAIKSSIPRMNPRTEIDIITRVFQGIRIAVNGELEALKKALDDSIGLLGPKGRIVVISYHSLEDRIVKTTFKDAALDCVCPPKQPICTCEHRKKLDIITKKPVIPGDEEIKSNPRSRSAKLRAALVPPKAGERK